MFFNSFGLILSPVFEAVELNQDQCLACFKINFGWVTMGREFSVQIIFIEYDGYEDWLKGE